ncbi:Uncharacterised ACR, YggU family COG1872 [Legionella lansingensis]|uniref:UPF0235 protein Llan_1459 n=1 Tax=Legionella lansingensis TaxID=45067 RepID=A0A0W0VPV5_9GAMM|nr:DUF167 domain-containing protein [Legionella lansingensis]KTD22196.1 hypothetical protein Llan_1459 [Legionella lansingensis]SNV54907.1 Uncharacterised ACR, YggU family COG1872 [Legionella lansingensis]
MSCPSWLKRAPRQLQLEVKIKPGAKENKISLDSSGGLQISLQARPEDGKANKMLIQYLSKYLKVTQKQMSILRGATSRTKLLGIDSNDAEQERLVHLLFKVKQINYKT